MDQRGKGSRWTAAIACGRVRGNGFRFLMNRENQLSAETALARVDLTFLGKEIPSHSARTAAWSM